MGDVRGALVCPRRATRPPLGLGVSNEGAGAGLAFGEVVVAVLYARVSLGSVFSISASSGLRTSWPRTVPRCRSEAKAQRRRVCGIPYAGSPRLTVRRAFVVVVVERYAACVVARSGLPCISPTTDMLRRRYPHCPTWCPYCDSEHRMQSPLTRAKLAVIRYAKLGGNWYSDGEQCGGGLLEAGLPGVSSALCGV